MSYSQQRTMAGTGAVESNIEAGATSVIPTVTPATNPGRMASVTGQEPEMLLRPQWQWRVTSRFTWSSATPPGTLVYYAPVHPGLNEWTAHLALMFNTWSGSFEFGVEPVATAFHCGKLLFVRIPPNIHPESVKTAEQATGFESATVDVKQMGRVEAVIKDQNPIAYHYTRMAPQAGRLMKKGFGSDELIDSLTIGGWIAVYVLATMNTAAATNNQITVLFWAKPSQEFSFSQILPLGLLDDTIPFSVPSLQNFLTFNPAQKKWLWPEAVQARYFIMSTISIMERMRVYDYTTEGQRIAAVDYDGELSLFSRIIMMNVNGTKLGLAGFDGRDIPTMPPFGSGVGFNIGMVAYDDKQNIDVSNIELVSPATDLNPWEEAGSSKRWRPTKWVASASVASLKAQVINVDLQGMAMEKQFWLKDPPTYAVDGGKAVPFAVSVPNEVICWFSQYGEMQTDTGAPNIASRCMPADWQNACREGVFKGVWPMGQALRMALTDSSTAQTLGDFKLYSQGVITTTKKSSVVVLDLGAASYEFVPIAWIPENSLLTNPPIVTRNLREALLYQATRHYM